MHCNFHLLLPVSNVSFWISPVLSYFVISFMAVPTAPNSVSYAGPGATQKPSNGWNHVNQLIVNVKGCHWKEYRQSWFGTTQRGLNPWFWCRSIMFRASVRQVRAASLLSGTHSVRIALPLCGHVFLTSSVWGFIIIKRFRPHFHWYLMPVRLLFTSSVWDENRYCSC